jgi:hypothetical protein
MKSAYSLIIPSKAITKPNANESPEMTYEIIVATKILVLTVDNFALFFIY